MKIGFNEGCNRFCENHSVLEDLDLCEKYGVDYIDIQSECLDREIAAGKYTIDDLAAWFADPKHHLKMLSYNALIFFNMKQTQEEKDAVMAKLDQIIEDCNKLQCKMIVVVPSMDLTVPATLDEIKADAVAVRHGEYAVRRCLQQRREASVAGRAGRLPRSQALRRYPQEDRL